MAIRLSGNKVSMGLEHPIKTKPTKHTNIKRIRLIYQKYAIKNKIQRNYFKKLNQRKNNHLKPNGVKNQRLLPEYKNSNHQSFEALPTDHEHLNVPLLGQSFQSSPSHVICI